MKHVTILIDKTLQDNWEDEDEDDDCDPDIYYVDSDEGFTETDVILQSLQESPEPEMCQLSLYTLRRLSYIPNNLKSIVLPIGNFSEGTRNTKGPHLRSLRRVTLLFSPLPSKCQGCNQEIFDFLVDVLPPKCKVRVIVYTHTQFKRWDPFHCHIQLSRAGERPSPPPSFPTFVNGN